MNDFRSRRRRGGPESPPIQAKAKVEKPATSNHRIATSLPFVDPRSSDASKHKKRGFSFLCKTKSQQLFLMLAGILFFVWMTTSNTTSLPKTTRFNFLSNKHNDPIPLLIPYLIPPNIDDTVAEKGDVGGWLFAGSTAAARRQLSLVKLQKHPPIDAQANLVDTGGLSIPKLSSKDWQRQIRDNDFNQYELQQMAKMEQMDQETISKRHWFADELEDIHRAHGCRRVAFEKLHFPTCNAFHEIVLGQSFDKILAQRSGDKQDQEIKYLSHGYFRDVFALNGYHNDKKAVLKLSRFSEHDMNYRPIYNAKRDALVMERLSSSPSIIDIYGHCGSSIMVESMPKEVADSFIPNGRWMDPQDLNDEHDVDVQNNFTVEEKLNILLEMAQSIAELHGYKEGVIVHDDIQLYQWLWNDAGKMKLGDFGRSRVLNWSDKHQEYCDYTNGGGSGSFRAPEEYADTDLSEKHDVWSFGNVVFVLMTGLWPHYDAGGSEVVQARLLNHTLPYIDPRYRTRSYGEGQMVKIIERCWVYSRRKRIEIFEVVDILRETVKENNRRNAHKKIKIKKRG